MSYEEATVTPDEAGADLVVGEVIHPVSAMTVSQNRAEIDMQIATAKAYPRSVTNFKRETQELACNDQKTAESMFYSIPRGGKHIVGPSIRLAEIVIATWGNLRVETRIVDRNSKNVIVEAVCWDIEKNSAVKEVKSRKVHGKKARDGTRLPADDDMIDLAVATALSIALRNAVFRVVPRVYVNEAMRKAQEVAVGKDKPIETRRADLMSYFQLMGVNADRVLAAAEVKGVDDIGMDEMIYLRGLATSIKEGNTTIDEAFPDPAKENAKQSEANAARAAVEKKKRGEPASEKQPEVQAAAAPAAQATEEAKPAERASASAADDNGKAQPAEQPQRSPERSEEGSQANSTAEAEKEWITKWRKQIAAITKETSWTKPFSDLVGLHDLNSEANKPVSESLLWEAVERLGVILKTRSQAAIVSDIVANCHLSDKELRSKLAAKVDGFVAALAAAK